MNIAAPPSVPPPAIAGKPFSVAAHRAFNDALEKRQRVSRNPELALRRARAEIDAALAMLGAGARRVTR